MKLGFWTLLGKQRSLAVLADDWRSPTAGNVSIACRSIIWTAFRATVIDRIRSQKRTNSFDTVESTRFRVVLFISISSIESLGSIEAFGYHDRIDFAINSINYALQVIPSKQLKQLSFHHSDDWRDSQAAVAQTLYYKLAEVDRSRSFCQFFLMFEMFDLIR